MPKSKKTLEEHKLELENGMQVCYFSDGNWVTTEIIGDGWTLEEAILFQEDIRFFHTVEEARLSRFPDKNLIIEKIDTIDSDIHTIISEALGVTRQEAKLINLSIFGRLLAVQDRADILSIYDKSIEFLNKKAFTPRNDEPIYYVNGKEVTSMIVGVGITLKDALELQKTTRLFSNHREALSWI